MTKITYRSAGDHKHMRTARVTDSVTRVLEIIEGRPVPKFLHIRNLPDGRHFAIPISRIVELAEEIGVE